MINLLDFAVTRHNTRAEAIAGVDSSAGIQAALDELGDPDDLFRGGMLVVPDGYYRVSESLIARRSGAIVGESTVGRFGRACLCFDHGKNITLQYATETADESRADCVAIRGIKFYGPDEPGDSVVAGVDIHCPFFFEYCSAIGFNGAGFGMNGGLLSPMKNVNTSSMAWCYAENNTSHGFHIYGGNANACSFFHIIANSNGGAGIYDSSFLGNTYYSPMTEANVGPAIMTDGSTNRTTIINPYVDLAQGECRFSRDTLVLGGNTYGPIVAADNGPYMKVRSFSDVAPFQVQNTYGEKEILVSVGRPDASQTAFAWSSSDQGYEYRFRYSEDTNAQQWYCAYTGASRVAYVLTSNGHAQGGGWLNFPNGYMVGPHVIVTAGYECPTGASPRADGLWYQGDRVMNAGVTSTSATGWVCIGDGNPGTWRALYA